MMDEIDSRVCFTKVGLLKTEDGFIPKDDVVVVVAV